MGGWFYFLMNNSRGGEANNTSLSLFINVDEALAWILVEVVGKDED